MKLSDQTIVITGATGLVGQALGQRLARDGARLRVLCRETPENARPRLPFPARIFRWDGEAAAPAEAFEGATAVVHLAGEPIAEGRWTAAKKRRILRSRVQGTLRLREGLRENGVRLRAWVQASAVGAYGDRGDELLDERSSRGTGFLADVCRQWEEAAPMAGGGEAERVALLRFGVVLSPRGGALARMIPPFRAGLGARLGDGRAWFPWIHVDDLVEALVRGIEDDRMAGALNAVAPEPVTNAELTRRLAEALGRKTVAPPVPRLALRALFGEMAGEALLASQRAAPARLRALGFPFRFPDLPSALADACRDRATDEVFEARTWVDRAPEEIFAFFSDAANLEAITPDSLGFEIVSKSTPAIQAGTLIDYRLRIHGVPARWRTRIEDWDPPRRFVDTQLAGPYAKWHHVHEFEPLAGGTLMRDRVLYRLPLGTLGRIAGAALVRRDVEGIFRHRNRRIAEEYPDREPDRSTAGSA